jgi:methylmalonyl-CoA mutase N-terminal domain/subunit
MVRAIESGWPQQQIADASWRLQQEVESGERIVVGVNRFVEDTPHHVPTHRHAERVEVDRAAELAALRAERDPAAVDCALDKLSQAAATTVNVMPFLIEAVKAYATVGEISDVLRKAFGVHTENTRY